MEGEAAAAVLQVLVQNLIDHSKKEISLIRGLHKEAEKLTGSLDMIQNFLKDAEMRTIHGEAVKIWLNKLENAAFEADNVLDEINYHLLFDQVLPMIKPTKEKVLSCFCSSFNHHIARPRRTALRIKEINHNLDSIHKEATDLGLTERLDNADMPNSAALETDSFADVPTYVGRNDVELEIVGMLTTNNSTTTHERVTCILSIVGMGGLGKTTLIRKVFNHQKIKTQLGLLIWVHVSQSFDSIILFNKMLKELNSDEGESRQDVLKRLKEALKGKTYLLVLDDVWNQDPLKWEDFINSLSGVTATMGNAIVVTTRNMEVASIVNPLHTHELRGLSDEDCWSIIKAKTFGKEGGVVVPSEFQTIGRKIARRCQGSPLAANVVGGVLRHKSKEKWLSIQEKWLSRVEGDSITKILRLSFDNLSPPSLKKCFAYCSMFPKGYIIMRQQLIEFWMAEGFLQDDEEGNDDLESVGEKIINILLQNSLLQVAQRDDDYGNARYYSCVMHDLVHDLACSISGSSSDINADSSSRVRHMILQGKSSSITIKKEESKHLRTLLLEGEISGIMLSDFKGLHVLGVYNHGVKELPDSIRKLIHLRHLDISKTQIESLPEWICELHFLLTLGAETHSLKKLPSTLKYLINLRHLYIRSVVQSPAEIGRLTHLRTLRYFRVGDEKGCQIEELGSLNNLKGELKISNLEKVGGKEEAAKAKLFKKTKLLKLHLEWSRNRGVETDNSDENALEGLQPHSDLNKLWIKGFEGRRFPIWTMKMAVQHLPQASWLGLNSLVEIKLSLCSGCEEIPMLGHLPNLKSLMLVGLSSVVSIDSSFYGLVNANMSRIVFPALERLKIIDMPKMAEWAEVDFAEYSASDKEEVKVFPRLEYLEIKECKLLMSVPTHLSSSSCLKLLEIYSIGVKCLPDCLFINNPNLSELEIKDCPSLRELPKGLHTLSYLEKLNISNCENLNQIGNNPSGEEEEEEERSFTSLRIIDINSCNALKSLPCEMVGSSLEQLHLVRLSSLENLPTLIHRLPKSPRLTHLRIIDVPVPDPELIASSSSSSSTAEIWPFGSLRQLTMDVSMESVGGILQGCRDSLDSLTLNGMETWDSLPESIQHLKFLSWLKLENFGMEELAEWFGNLSSLRTLALYKCKNLRRLASMEAMRRLIRLESLAVKDCPELVIRSDSEWPKVSHIPQIIYDGSLIKAVDSEESGREEGGVRKHMCLRCL